MKTVLHFSLILAVALFLGSCKNTSPLGEKVKEPFTGSKYESNNRYFRAVGKGVSIKDNVARSKADMDAKTILAGQIESNVKQVGDSYFKETGFGDDAEITETYQNLSRQVMNTSMSDLRKFDEEKYYNGDDYTVYIAYEIKKAAMFRFMKKKARIDAKVDAQKLKAIEEMLDMEIERLEALDD